jgi:hypothetical protein
LPYVHDGGIGRVDECRIVLASAFVEYSYHRQYVHAFAYERTVYLDGIIHHLWDLPRSLIPACSVIKLPAVNGDYQSFSRKIYNDQYTYWEQSSDFLFEFLRFISSLSSDIIQTSRLIEVDSSAYGEVFEYGDCGMY